MASNTVFLTLVMFTRWPATRTTSHLFLSANGAGLATHTSSHTLSIQKRITEWSEMVDSNVAGRIASARISVDYALIFTAHTIILVVYYHRISVYVLIFGVYAIIFSVYDGIFGDYELIPDVYDLIFGDYEGKIAGNEGIFGVLKGEFGVLQS
jgi:hypothetical protein